MDRKELQELWRSRVVEAKLRFQSARDHTNAIVREFPLADTSPDSRYAYRRAVGLENAALAEYNRVLRICERLAHGGTAPDEGEGLRPGSAASGGAE